MRHSIKLTDEEVKMFRVVEGETRAQAVERWQKAAGEILKARGIEGSADSVDVNWSTGDNVKIYTLNFEQ